MSNTFAIGGATLIDGTGADPVANATVVVTDGKIVYAGASDKADIPAGAEIIEADGATVMPGLSDPPCLNCADERAGGGATPSKPRRRPTRARS